MAFNEINRRDFLRKLALGSLTFPLLSNCTINPGNPKSSAKQKPVETPLPSPTPVGLKSENSNILFVVIDDLNDWVSPLGGYYGTVHTPNLDRLAGMGITFSNAYCSVPWCAPSRAATLMGVSAGTTGYYGQAGDYTQFGGLINRETIPGYFKRKGYRTMGGGKIFHGDYFYGTGASPSFNPQGQQNRSWDEYQTYVDEPRPSAGPNNDLLIPFSQFDWSSSYQPSESLMPDRLIADWAAQKLLQPTNQPFFLAAGIYRPHLPWYAPKKYYDMYPLADIRIPTYLLTDDLNDLPTFAKGFAISPPDQARLDERDDSQHIHWRQAVQAYLASISFADACLGRMLDALAAGPHAQNTTVVVWSDNGFQLGEKKGWRKFKLWEKSARVPLLISTPGRLNAGRKCTKPVSLLDIYPTLTDLCKDEIPPSLEGKSLKPLLLEPTSAWSKPAITTYSAAYDGSQLHRSARSETHRYILYFDGSEELYDHRIDPYELKNLLSPIYGLVSASRPLADALRGALPTT